MFFFTSHINLQLVLTLSGTAVINAGSTRMKVFTTLGRLYTEAWRLFFFPEKCKTNRICWEPSFQQRRHPPHFGGCVSTIQLVSTQTMCLFSFEIKSPFLTTWALQVLLALELKYPLRSCLYKHNLPQLDMRGCLLVTLTRRVNYYIKCFAFKSKR